MRLQHETSLIPASWSALNAISTQQTDQFTSVASFGPIELCCWSQVNSTTLCVYLSGQNQVVVFDSKSYDKKEKFSLKPVDKKYSRSSFTVKGFQFSPDGTRLAIGQSDCIIYIYKLPNSSAGPTQQQPVAGALASTTSQQSASQQTRPTITGKFASSSPITCLVWLECGLVFGSQDGKVKIIATSSPDQQQQRSTNSNKVVTVMAQQSLVISMVGSVNSAYLSDMLVVGYLNGSVMLASNLSGAAAAAAGPSETGPQQPSQQQRTAAIQTSLLLDHSCAPFALCLTSNNYLCIGGPDGKLFIGQLHQDAAAAARSPSASGQSTAPAEPARYVTVRNKQTLDVRSDVQKIDCSPSGDLILACVANKMLLIKLDSKQLWRICYNVTLKNGLMISALVWSPDGSQVVAGTLNGALELFSCQWNRRSINDSFEINYLAKNHISIKNTQTQQLCAMVKSAFHIDNVKLVMNGQFAVVWTTHTLALVRMAGLAGPSLVSELNWSGMSKQNVRFCFDYSNVVAVALAGEIMLVELGTNHTLYSVRSDYANRHLISVKGFEAPDRDANINNNRSFCYLVDAKSLSVVDLRSKLQLCSWTNSLAIDWLELSDSGSALLFRDRSLQLYLLKLRLHHRSQDPGKPTESPLSLYQAAGPHRQSIDCVKLIKPCTFAQWIDGTSVIVAQSGYNIHIWYDLTKAAVVYDARTVPTVSAGPQLKPQATQRAQYPDIVSIERRHQQQSTQIMLSNGGFIELDMIFIEFDSMMRQDNLFGALALLESRTGGSSGASLPASSSGQSGKPELQTKNNVDEHKSIHSLWQILANKALVTDQLKLAERALAQLGEYAKCRYLRSCRQDEAQCKWKLALLRNDWNAFESLADTDTVRKEYKKLNRWTRAIAYLDNRGQYRLKDMTEREYHQWLISKGQFVEASRQMAQSGQLLEALQLLLRNNRLKFAARLLLDHYGGLSGASGAPPGKGSVSSSSLFLSSRFTVNNNQMKEIIAQIKNKLIEGAHYEQAAKLCESKLLLNEPIEALQLYTKANTFSKAISLARDHCPDKVVQLEEQYGDHIMSLDSPIKKSQRNGRANNGQRGDRQPKTAAIDHYIEAGKLDKALQAAMQLHQYDKAAQILPSMGDQFNETIVEYCKQLGDYHRSKGLTEEAVSFYKLARHNKSAIDTYLDRAQFAQAYQLAGELMPNDKDKVDEMFTLVARKLASDSQKQQPDKAPGDQLQRLVDAEKVYVMLGKIDEAIDMYKATGHYEQMVKLIREHHPDLLENSLIMLAGELESQGALDKAERYYLMASSSEWINVVRMYRNGQRWSDAYRVCVQHEPQSGPQTETSQPVSGASGQNQRVQIAYWWSKSLGSVEDAVKMLNKLDQSARLTNQVLQYAVENRQFDYALEMVEAKEYRALQGDSSSDQLKSKILLKYASWLEQQGKFAQAEKLLTDGGLITEAVEMYIESGMFTEALRLAEKHPQLKYTPNSAHDDNNDNNNNNKEHSLIDQVLLSHASYILKAANQLNHDASSPGQSSSAKRSMLDALSQAQQLYLRANRPDLAVEMYQSRSMWQEAIQVARKFAPNLLTSVEQNEPSDYVSVSSSQAGSDLFELIDNNNLIYSVDQPNERSVSTSASSSDTNTVNMQQNNYGSQINKLDSGIHMVQSGNGQLELDHVAITKQISSAIDKDERLHVRRLLCRHVVNLINLNEWSKAINCVSDTAKRASYVFTQQEVLNVILRLSSAIMTDCPWGAIQEQGNSDYSQNDVTDLWFSLRDLLLLTNLNDNILSGINNNHFHRHLMAAHYISLHYSLLGIFCEQQQLIVKGNLDETSYGIQHSVLGLLTSISISLLRYSDLVSVDRAFYVAGYWCIQAKKMDLAYIYWKHLLELLEAIDSKSRVDTIDNEPFKNTDIPPVESLPEHQFSLASSVKEQVQDWVLQNLLTFDTDPRLPLDSRGIYEASLQREVKTRPSTMTNNNKSDNRLEQYPSCLISGYPVLDLSKAIEFKRVNSPIKYAVRHKDWNTFLSLLRRSTDHGEQLLSRVMEFISQLVDESRDSIEEYKF